MSQVYFTVFLFMFQYEFALSEVYPELKMNLLHILIPT